MTGEKCTKVCAACEAQSFFPHLTNNITLLGGAGKSPAFQHGCAQPVQLHVKSKEDIPLFIDEFIAAGLFRQLKSVLRHKAIISK